jgi:hypothetical protein
MENTLSPTNQVLMKWLISIENFKQKENNKA